MWAAIVGALGSLFAAVPKVLSYLNLNKVLKKNENDKEARLEDIEDVVESDETIEEIVEDGNIEDINDAFGWKE